MEPDQSGERGDNKHHRSVSRIFRKTTPYSMMPPPTTKKKQTFRPHNGVSSDKSLLSGLSDGAAGSADEDTTTEGVSHCQPLATDKK